jgi:hypothetical protein
MRKSDMTMSANGNIASDNPKTWCEHRQIVQSFA